MPRDLFNVGTTPSAVTRALSRYTVVCSAAALHLVIIAVVLIAPLLADTVLPKPDLGRVQHVNATFVPPNPPAAPRSAAPAATVPNHNAAPVVPPDHISDEQPAPALDFAKGGLDSIGPVSNNVISIGDSLGPAPSAPPMPTPVRTPPQKPVPVGGAIAEPVKIHNVAPVYPAIAQSARVEGTVVIQAIISTDGAVQEAHVVSGAPLLNEAALSAVKQWRYTPTTLNKQPVAVIMTVTVAFRLQH